MFFFFRQHIMPQPHEPEFEVDVTAIIEVGLTPFGILVLGQTVLDDAHHVQRIQHVTFLKVAHTTYFFSYPVPLAAAVEELFVDNFC
jgi:hypothetical protein